MLTLGDTQLFSLTDSVKTFQSEPFRSQNFSVLVFLVSRHVGEAMKSWRNLICSLFNAYILNTLAPGWIRGFSEKNA